MKARLWHSETLRLAVEAEFDDAVADAAGADVVAPCALASLEALEVCAGKELLVALVLEAVELPHWTTTDVVAAVVTVPEGVAVPTVE